MSTAVKKWKKEEIRELIDNSRRAQVRGLKVIFSLQTMAEQDTGSTRVWNGVGFTAFDAEILTNLYHWYERYGRFSEKQWALLGRKIRRYAGQLAKVANGEIEVSV